MAHHTTWLQRSLLVDMSTLRCVMYGVLESSCITCELRHSHLHSLINLYTESWNKSYTSDSVQTHADVHVSTYKRVHTTVVLYNNITCENSVWV